ncbi:MAG: DNA repair protein RecO [bacterium]|nr:DNA repair protein RecO [bacterium]
MGILNQPSVSCDAVVLRSWPCGETSVITSVLTKDQGFVRLLAKAARRPRSTLRPLVEPGRILNVEFSLNATRELQYLRSGSVQWDPMTTGLSLEQSAYLLAVLELVDRCRPAESTDNEPASEELFEVCDAFIRMLSSFPEACAGRLFFAFEWQFLHRHGLDPEVNCCSSCGKVAFLDETTAESNQRPSGALWFDVTEGGLICSECGVKIGGGRPLSAGALQEFRNYETGSFVEDGFEEMPRALRREIGGHLHRFLGFHLPGYRLPSALELLRPAPSATVTIKSKEKS